MFLLKNIEEILASIAISITVLVVIVNVVLRYGFGFVVPWSEELSVICFIWAVYLGISSCYKHKLHMGVDVVVAMLPEKAKIPFRLCVSVFLLALNILMAVLSYQYLMLSNKVTPVMGVSYFVINGVLLLCFSLMAIHTVRFIAN
ncbi:TRAP transporter small permease, partial [Vibrio sp. 10N.261.52.A1]